MKKYILLLFLGLTGTLHAQVLPVPNVKQEQTNWCAAAAAECVLRYHNITNIQYGNHYGQCAIMTWVRDANPALYGTANCCPAPPSTFPYPCNKEVPLGFNDEKHSIHEVLKHFSNGAFAGPTILDTLTIAQIRSFLLFSTKKNVKICNAHIFSMI